MRGRKVTTDPALFVQCRFVGRGYTLSYGRALTWPLTLVWVAPIAALIANTRIHP